MEHCVRCWAKDYCKKYMTESCNQFCDVHVLLKAIYSQSNIPKKYQHDKQLTVPTNSPDFKAFKELNDFKNNVVSLVGEGRGLYIWSETTGNGKTSWATKIANYYIRKVVFQGEIENVVCYINVPTFLEDLRSQYREPTEQFSTLKERVLKSKIVIFDDIGAEKPTEWVQERMYEIINYRDNEMLSSIYTSNIPLNDLREKLGTRIWSRIKGHADVVELKGGDRR